MCRNINREGFHVLRTPTENQIGKPVGCGESANRIEGLRLTNDAVSFGHHILQTIACIFEGEQVEHEGRRVWSSEPSCPSCLRGKNFLTFVVKAIIVIVLGCSQARLKSLKLKLTPVSPFVIR